ncbi:hypothetical protein ACWGJ2_32685 [Streptomyces sp. NPDC054796]
MSVDVIEQRETTKIAECEDRNGWRGSAVGRPAEGGGGSAPQGKGIKVPDSLLTFKKRIDGILKDLENSPAAKNAVAGQQIPRSSLSGGATPFEEADGLFRKYNEVHEALTSLSQTLGDQIEAVGIAVHGAHVGFGNLDDDVRRRFWEIQTRTHERAEEERRRRERDAQDHGRPGDDKGKGKPDSQPRGEGDEIEGR